jgi:methionyl-tRNA formyltransferase
VPAFRGKKTMFWAMATGETEAGVTIQRINAGIDTGEIVAEGTVPIHNRLPHQVWRDLEALGLQLYLESILAIKNNIATFTPQAGKKGKLYSDPTWQDLVAFYKKWMFKKIFGTQTSADERG